MLESKNISKLKRCVIFAHYDKQNMIDDYVINYLKRLKDNFCDIIFVSDGNVAESELKKIEDLIFDSFCENHNESFDFGSYKRGFQLLREKYWDYFNELDELLFVNDSCYAIGGFESVFAKTKDLDVDAWSLGGDFVNLNREEYYLQAYFIAFRSDIFKADFFKEFLYNIRKIDDKTKVVLEYEIGFSRLLYKNGKDNLHAVFSHNVVNNYISNNIVRLGKEVMLILKSYYRKNIVKKNMFSVFSIYQLNYIHCNKYYFLIDMGFPLIKRALLLEDRFTNQKLTYHWRSVLQMNGICDIEIMSNLSRCNYSYKKRKKEGLFNEIVNKIRKL